MTSYFSQKVLDSRKIAKKSDVHNRVTKGLLFSGYYDTETTDLNKRFAEILQFAGVTTDLAGNVLHTVDYRGKPSGNNVISPFAWVVQHLHERDLEQGDPQYVLAGKIAQYFRHLGHLNESPYTQELLKMCRYTKAKNGFDGYYSYPVLDDEGEIDWNYLRINENLQKIYVYDAENDTWNKRKCGGISVGYNNVNADDQWIWTGQHMACMENIFSTHLPQNNLTRLDALRATEALYSAGQKGENGIKSGTKKHPITGKEILSFSQGDVMEANTHHASQLRGILEGFTQPDGTHVDIDQLHGALKDAYALAGWVEFMQQREPELMQQMENNINWKDVVDRMSAKRGSIGSHPILAYTDKIYPVLTKQMVTLITTDAYRHNPKTALVFNLNIDPETYRWPENGKTLKEMNKDEFALLIQDSLRNHNGLFKIIKAHHNPRLLDIETGFAAGFNNGLPMPKLHEHAKYFRDPSLIQTIKEGFHIARPRLDGPERLLLPQPEEELFNLSTFEIHDPEAGEDAQVHQYRYPYLKAVHDSRKSIMQITGYWLEAIGPDDDAFLDNFENDDENLQNALQKFKEKIKKINKKLETKGGPLLPEPDQTLSDQTSVRRYKAKLLFFARNHFASGTLQDIGDEYWFENRHGHRIPEDTLKEWSLERITQAKENGDLNVCHEQLYFRKNLIDRNLEQLGLSGLLRENDLKELHAVKTLKHHGIPAQNGNDRWYTLTQARKDVQKLLDNELMDDDIKALDRRMPGVWETFMNNNHGAQASLASYISYLEKLEKLYPEFTPESQLRVGINPQTGKPIQRSEYVVVPSNVLQITVPERYIQDPVLDPVNSQPLWIIPLTKTFNQNALEKALKANKDIILTASVTGKQFHLPKAVKTELPARGGAWEKFYRQVQARYTDSALAFPDTKRLIALTGEGPYPLHVPLENITLPKQSLLIASRHLEALIDHKFTGHKTPVGGIAIRDDKLHLENGPIQLLEKDELESKPTGWVADAFVSSAKHISLKEVSKLSDKQARHYGYPNSEDMKQELSTVFADKKRKFSDPNNKVWLIDFSKIAPQGMCYKKPDTKATSIIKTDYQSLLEQMHINGT